VCFLLGSPDEKGKVVPDTDALYDRSAEFLFNAVAFPQIQTQLVDFLAVNGRQSYATFGSFSVPLPKARYVEKYMMKMGHELLEDVFASTAAANYADGLANVFNGGRIDQLNQVESLPPIREIDTILFSQVFIHNTPDNHKAATEAIDAEYQHWMALRGQQLQKANAESAEIVRSLEERLEEERKRIWNLDKGSLAALHTLYEATIGRIDATMVALNKGTPAQMENDIYSAYHAAQGLLNIGGKKPSDRLNAFRTELPVAARAQMAFECSSRARTLLGLLRGKLVENLAKLTRLLSEGKVTISDFDSRSVKFLGERRSGGSANLMSDAVGQSNVDSAQYDVDRIGLLQRCRAKMRLDALLDSKWSINLEHFVELLFAQTSEYVSDRVATAQLLDRKALLDGLNKAWTNLSMQQGPGTNRWVSNKLFAPRDEELRTQIREIVRDWPGFATGVEFEDPVDDSMLSFLRVVGQFPIEDITEVKQLKRAYDAKMQKEDDAFFLRLPTHRTYEVALDNQEAEKSKRYALAICSGVLADFGQAMEFAGVLQQEIADPVARRRTTREMLLNPDRYIKVQKQLEKLRKATGSNLAFADQLYDKLQVNYAADENEDPETDLDRMIAEEREQMLNYLGTLGIKKYAGGGGTN
jgi:hypothetical protein